MKAHLSRNKGPVKIPRNAHTVFSFNLPYAIPIPDGTYKVVIGNKGSLITLKRIQREQGGWKVSKGMFQQLRFDKFGRSSFSSVAVEVPKILDLMERGRIPLTMGKIPPRMKAKEMALRFLNRLIEVVRYITEEFWIEPARYQDIISYEMFYWDAHAHKKYPLAKAILDTGVGGVSVGNTHPFQLKPEKMKELVKTLHSGAEVDPSRLFLLNSKDACLQEDFRLAVIEAVTALEITLYRFLKIQGAKIGISTGDINSYITGPNGIGLTGNMRVALKLFTKDLDQVDDDIQKKCAGAIKIRNKILHEGLMDMSSTDTEERVIAIEKMLDYLNHLMSII